MLIVLVVSSSSYISRVSIGRSVSGVSYVSFISYVSNIEKISIVVLIVLVVSSSNYIRSFSIGSRRPIDSVSRVSCRPLVVFVILVQPSASRPNIESFSCVSSVSSICSV